MLEDPARKYQRDAQRYLQKVSEGYTFDGVYKPKGYEKRDQKAYQKPGSDKWHRFFTDPKRDWVTAVISIATLLVVGAYTEFARRQWHEMQRAANEAHSATVAAQDSLSFAKAQLQEEERPYIWFTATSSDSPKYVAIARQFIITYHYTNYGKTPAQHVVMVAHEIRVGKNAPWKTSHGFHPHPPGIPCPPNKDDFTTVVSEPGVTPQEFRDLLSQDEAVGFRAVIQYADGYGARYESGICLLRLAGGAFEYCTTGNYIRQIQ